ncbi:MAG TPA: Rossmann fold nucleotide-binding protein [Friedmanniella sp.]
MTTRSVEIDSLADFDAHVARTRTANGWFVSSVDLRDRTDDLLRVDPRGAVFLGCRFGTVPVDVAERLRAGGALLFPALPDVPFNPYRPLLYSPEELYGVVDGERPAYQQSPDSVIYAWTRARAGNTLTADLAATLHDHSVDGALDDVTDRLDPARVVGVMGGHALRRSDPAYAATARLGDGLTRAGRTVLTGGGPGAMEAANLGASLSGWDGALAEALAQLGAAPDYVDGIDAWATAAFAVRDRWSGDRAGESLSIPTWFYGHEPTNVFGTAIAKYFANALREDTLLHRCRGGIVFAPGAAGTVQEIFQAANDRFYAAPGTAAAPLVLLGRDHWTRTLPAWPLLEALSRDSPMAGAVHVVDDLDEALALVTAS